MTLVSWAENGVARQALWRSATSLKPPSRIEIADDTWTADHAYRAMCEGASLLWRGDFQNGRQMLLAVARRVDRSMSKAVAPAAEIGLNDRFNRYRQAQAQRASILNKLLVLVKDDYVIDLRRAPDARAACEHAYGVCGGAAATSLRELQGVIGAFQWRLKGVHIAALGQKIYPHYGVFSPVRGEYVDLVARMPLPLGRRLAFDVGCGTGVLAAVLARRGFEHVIGSDQESRAVACATETISALGLQDRVEILQIDLYPAQRADLIVCNPPWLPGRPSSSLDSAIYDPDSRMLRGILGQAHAHLTPRGEVWLILSDLAEHLQLRSREELLAMIDGAGLRVIGREDTRPTHSRANDPDDPLHAARSAEITSLWRLAHSN